MYKYLFLFIAIIGLSSCAEQISGNGQVTTETRETADFHSIDVGGSFDVVISQGNYSSFTIEADENLLPYINSRVEKGVLYVSADANFRNYKKLELKINVQNFKAISASGATEIRSDGVLKGETVDLHCSGANEMYLSLVAEKLNAELSGASELHLKGQADSFELEASGASDINADEFVVKDYRIEMSGAGEADIVVTGTLDIEVSGAAEIRYRGNPGTVSQEVSGAASIKHL